MPVAYRLEGRRELEGVWWLEGLAESHGHGRGGGYLAGSRIDSREADSHRDHGYPRLQGEPGGPPAPAQQAGPVPVHRPLRKYPDGAASTQMAQRLHMGGDSRLEKGLESVEDARSGILSGEGDGPGAVVEMAHPGDEPEVPVRQEAHRSPAPGQQEDRGQQDRFPSGAVVGHEQEGVVGGVDVLQALNVTDAAEGEQSRKTCEKPVAGARQLRQRPAPEVARFELGPRARSWS